jgi:hypothetical protein
MRKFPLKFLDLHTSIVSNYLKVLRIHGGWLTGVCSSIQVEQVLFDDPQKLGCLTQIKFDVEQQLSNKTLIEHNSCPRLLIRVKLNQK